MEFWNQRTICLLTGASRGIGKEIAIQFSKKVGPGSVFILVARSAQGLQETKSILNSTRGDLQVITATLDLGSAESADYKQLINSALITTGTTPTDFDHCILIHNAASVGNLSFRAIELDSLPLLRSYYDLNFFSMILLTSEFFKLFNNPEKLRSVIQITSLAAVQPFKTCSLYCAGKAARDMFMKTIAIEDPSICILNYAPGPVDTEMFAEVITNTSDPEVAQEFKDANVLTPTQTVTKLVNILTDKKYTKGEHVDYYDEV